MEKQLLFLLDYDLRFDENEAITHFAPFMPRLYPSVRETRAAAVHCAKARVQAHVAMPPTPPHDDASQHTPSQILPLSGVQSLVKRLSSTYLSVSFSSTSSRSRPLSRASSSSATDSESTASYDSDIGWMTSDNGHSPASTDASSVVECETDNSRAPSNGLESCRDVQMTVSVPNEGRKSSSSSVGTVMVNDIAPTLKAPASTAPSASDGDYGAQRNVLSHSATSNGFLSRMWGVATKTQDRPDVNAGDRSGTSSAFRRRLTHSRSAFFRNHQSQMVDT